MFKIPPEISFDVKFDSSVLCNMLIEYLKSEQDNQHSFTSEAKECYTIVQSSSRNTIGSISVSLSSSSGSKNPYNDTENYKISLSTQSSACEVKNEVQSSINEINEDTFRVVNQSTNLLNHPVQVEEIVPQRVSVIAALNHDVEEAGSLAESFSIYEKFLSDEILGTGCSVSSQDDESHQNNQKNLANDLNDHGYLNLVFPEEEKFQMQQAQIFLTEDEDQTSSSKMKDVTSLHTKQCHSVRLPDGFYTDDIGENEITSEHNELQMSPTSSNFIAPTPFDRLSSRHFVRLQTGEFACVHCNFKSGNTAKAGAHYRRTHRNWMFHCKMCSYSNRQRINLAYHYKKMHNLEVKQAKLLAGKTVLKQVTDNVFITSSSNHKVVTTSGSNCSSQSSSSVSELSIPSAASKINVASIVPNCSGQISNRASSSKMMDGRRNFHSKQNLADTSIRLANNYGDQFACSQCSYTTNKKPYLKLHEARSHANKFFYCHLCSYYNRQLVNLKTHYARKHKHEIASFIE